MIRNLVYRIRALVRRAAMESELGEGLRVHNERQVGEIVAAGGGGATVSQMDYTGGLEPVQVHAAFVSAGLLETLGVAPMLGRWLSREEDVKGGPHHMVVTHRFWREFLNSDPQVLGKPVVLNGESYTVIGVMPPGFDLPEDHANVFVSLWVGYPEAAPWRGVHFMRTYWRLKPGVTVKQAQADLTGIATRLATEYADTEGKRDK